MSGTPQGKCLGDFELNCFGVTGEQESGPKGKTSKVLQDI